MNGRDQRGRFTAGNPYASDGGHARAQALTPDQRKSIARMGRLAFVNKYFDGDVQAANRYFSDLGAWAYNQPYQAWGEGFEKPQLPRREP